MEASRVITAAVVRSLASAGATVSVPQLRILAMVSANGSMNMAGVAARLGVNPSNASRSCDQLVAAGLLDRSENAEDRRHVDLAVTGEGKRLLRRLMKRREQLLAEVLGQMNDISRRRLTAALTDFNRAAQQAASVGNVLGEHAPGSAGDTHVLPWLT